jgi:hypothetical protein
MLHHVVHRLECHQVGGLLHSRRQRSSDLSAEPDARHLGRVERGDVVRQRCREPAIPHWCGLQVVGEPSDLGGGVPQADVELLGILLVGSARSHSLAQRLGRKPCSGKQRGNAIVQVAPQPRAFLGNCPQGSSSRRLQLGVATQCIDQSGGLVGELVEQCPVYPAVRFTGGV